MTMLRLSVFVLVVFAVACAPSVDFSGPAALGGINYWEGELVYESGERRTMTYIFQNSARIEGLGYVWDDGSIVWMGHIFEGTRWGESSGQWVVDTLDTTRVRETYYFVGTFTGTQFRGHFRHDSPGRQRPGTFTMAQKDPRD